MMNRTNQPSSQSIPARGLAGGVRRAARASARRPKTAIAIWVVLIVGLLMAGSAVGTRDSTATDYTVGESGRAEKLLDEKGLQDPATESVLLRSSDPATTTEAAETLAADLRGTGAVADVQSGTPELSAEDGRAQLLQVTLSGDPEEADGPVAAVERRVQSFDERHPDVTVDQAGSASLDRAAEEVVADDLARAELFSLPVILAILVVAFGALVAALVPLVLGITAVAGAMGAAALISHLVPDSGNTASVIVLIGLAVGVDYSLFYIRREREERRAGKGPEATLDATAATVGRAIVVSGLTVIVALAGLLVTGMTVFISIALGTMVVVALAMIGSITVLPALLQLLGERVERGRLPIVARRRAARPAGSGLWPRIVNRVARRPRLALLGSVAVLTIAAAPAIGMNLGDATAEHFPDDVEAVAALQDIETLFPGSPASTRLVVDGAELGSGTAAAELEDLGRRAAEVTGGAGSPQVQVSDDGTVAAIDVPMPEMSRDEATGVVERARDDVAPTMAGAEVLVTGDAAESADFTSAIGSVMPIVVGIVLALAFALLVAAFRSPWLAASVVALNLLSVMAAYGVMVAVFQHGFGTDLLGLTETGAVVSWLPLFAFVILFGLSMDYTVIVLERIREARLAGRTAREAVAEGVGATAGAVTSAAAVMVAVFSLFAMLRLPDMQQMGVGLGAAVLIDATIVRGIALPAAVALLGERRWRVGASRRRRSAPRSATTHGGIIERSAEPRPGIGGASERRPIPAHDR